MTSTRPSSWLVPLAFVLTVSSVAGAPPFRAPRVRIEPYRPPVERYRPPVETYRLPETYRPPVETYHPRFDPETSLPREQPGRLLQGIPFSIPPLKNKLVPHESLTQEFAAEQTKLGDEVHTLRTELGKAKGNVNDTVRVLSAALKLTRESDSGGTPGRLLSDVTEASLQHDAAAQLIDELKGDLPQWRLNEYFSRNSNLEGIERTPGEIVIYFHDGVKRTVLRLPRDKKALPRSLLRRSSGSEFFDLKSGHYGLYSWSEMRALYDRMVVEALSKNSTAELKLFSIDTTRKAPPVTFADGTRVEVTAAEWAQLKRGEPLPEEHALSRKLSEHPMHVLFTSPLQVRVDSPLTKAADECLFSLQRAYNHVTLVRDPLSSKTAERVLQLQVLQSDSPKEVVALVADATFGIKDGKLVQNIEEELVERGVKVEHFTPSLRWVRHEERLVLVISGHAGPELSRYVHAIGKAGLLRDNIVLLLACETGVSRELQTHVVERYGATGAFAYEGTIHTSQLEPFLLELTANLQKMRERPAPHAKAPEGCRNDCLDALVPRKDSERVPEPPHPEPPNPPRSPPKSKGLLPVLKDTLAPYNLNGVWVVCDLGERRPSIPILSRGARSLTRNWTLN